MAELGSDGSAPIWASLPDLPCRVKDPDLWFAEKPAELEQAKSFCHDCPVRRTCLAGAVARHEPWGVWGGEIFERGQVIARKRPRGRPRKDDREVAA
ncbi:MAG: WhiB family transcriptional regulator [Jatrophihabitans sp.]